MDQSTEIRALIFGAATDVSEQLRATLQLASWIVTVAESPQQNNLPATLLPNTLLVVCEQSGCEQALRCSINTKLKLRKELSR